MATAEVSEQRMNLYGLLAERFRPGPERPWVQVPGGRAVSYAEVDLATARIAALLHSLGVQPGDRVATQVDKSPEALLVWLGVARAGAVFLPLNPAYRTDELSYFLTDAEPSVLVRRPAGTPGLDRQEVDRLARRAGVAHVFDLDVNGRGSWSEAVAATAASSDDPIHPRGGDDHASIVYTSGTTGRSKGAMLSHGNLGSNALALHRIWGFEAGDVVLHALPVFHVHGLFVATHTAMLNASPMRFHPSFDAAPVVADLPNATVFMGVPTMYVRLLKEPGLTPEGCSHVRLFVSGSAPLLAETFEAFRVRTGHTILERYGMTETSMITSNPYEGERRGGTVGVPLPEVDVRVADEGSVPAPAGEVGEVQVRGPNVLLGYWRRPARSTADFTGDGWFRTGDLGTFDGEGYLTLVGRSKDLVITGGYNVYPKEVELLLDEVPGVVESAVIGVPHHDYGEAVTAVVVADRPLDEAAVIASLKPRLASYKVPKAVVVVDDLPRNAMGKVQKNILRDRLQSLYDAR